MPFSKENTYTTDYIYSLPEGQRAELIDGVIYDMAPPNRLHQELVMNLSAEIREYISKNNGFCKVYPAPFAVFLNKDDKTLNLISALFVTSLSWMIVDIMVHRTGSSRLRLQVRNELITV